MTKILQVVLLFCCLSIAALTQANDLAFEAIKAGSLEHKEKTLSALDMVFKHNRIDVMSRISSLRFQKSPSYKKLYKYISSSNHINLNYRSESATQEFIINDNEKHVLVVDFDHSKKTNLWYISNAYVKKWGRKSYLKELGFNNTNFGKDFNSIIKNSNYYGLAPHGKLNKSFFRGKKLSLSREKSLTIKDIIIHDGTKIVDIIFLTLRYYPASYKEGNTYKSGWLIDGGGSMSSLYKNNGDNLYTKVYFNRLKAKKINLSKKLKAETGIFKNSRLYQILQEYMRNNYSLKNNYTLKLNHNSTIARQEFTIKNQGQILVVDFSKKARKWYIADAYIKNNRQALEEHGFLPLEFERNFSALVKKMKYKSIENYYGLAPRGKLNSSFFKNKTLVVEENPIHRIEVFIYNGKQLVDILLLTYKYYEDYQYKGIFYKELWLMNEIFSIKDSSYKPGNNLYADIIFGEKLNLNAPNKGLIIYNLGELDSTPQNEAQKQAPSTPYHQFSY